jgi:hypothetical protein
MNKRYFLFFLLIFICSCKQEVNFSKVLVTTDNLEGIWRLTEIEISDDFYHASNSLEQRKVHGQIGQGYILSIFPNKELTRLIDNDMSVYTWNLIVNNKSESPSLIIKNEVESDTFSNISIEDNQGYVFLSCQYKNIGTFKFHLENKMLEDFKEDPYFSENNKWRITSKTNESQKQLKARITNYLNHYRLLLLSSTKRPNTKIRLMNSEGILRVFDGGIGLKPRSQISKRWLYKYYSDSQAYKVYDRLEKHFKNRVIKKKTKAGWRLDNVSIIDSLITVY